MRLRSALKSTTAKSAAVGIMGLAALASPVWSQEGGANAPWRGAGEKPCFGAEGGTHMCPPAKSVVAVRAGRLFDSKTGQMLTNQVVVLDGERITEVGPAATVKIPTDAQVIDLGQATVLPGLIDAHTHIFNPPKPGMSRETSTLIAIHNLQANLHAGFTASRDMTSHGNAYGDVDMRNAINEGRLDGPRLKVAGRGIVWSSSPPPAAPEDKLGRQVVRSADEARAAVREQVEHGVDLIKLYPTGAYSFNPA